MSAVCSCSCPTCQFQQIEIHYLTSGEVRIVCCHSHQVLDAPSGATTPGTPVQQYHYHGGANQRWWLVCRDMTRRLYEIKASYCDLVLEVTQGSRDRGALIQLTSSDGWAHQRFVLEQSPVCGEYFIRAWHSSLVLDVDNGSYAEKTTIQQAERHGGANQRFKFERCDETIHPALVYH